MATPRIALVATAMLGLVACSGKDPAPPDRPEPPATAPADAGVPVSGPPLTDEECGRFVDHVVEIAAASRPKLESTDEEIAGAQDKLRAELRQACLEEIGREAFECGMRAETKAALEECAR